MYILSVFKDNKSLRSHKTEEIMVFHDFFACCWEDPEPDPYKLQIIMDPGGQKNSGSGTGTLIMVKH